MVRVEVILSLVQYGGCDYQSNDGESHRISRDFLIRATARPLLLCVLVE